MQKAFLSHNGYDKDFVDEVFDRLGTLNAVYDKKTFNKNCDLSQQIREGLEDSDVYVLFLSEASINSGWVSSELDIAGELKTKWQLRKFLIFQLDGTDWSNLPKWANRYVVSCPPSPEIVALRIKDELRKETEVRTQAYGRDNDLRKIHDFLLEQNTAPSFIAFTGPEGIGRKTLANSLFHDFYKGIAESKISITLGVHDDDLTLYKRLLAYSANWRARDFQVAVQEFSQLVGYERSQAIANLIVKVTVGFNQVLILDVGGNAFGPDHKLLNWFSVLLNMLEPDAYPYVVVLLNGGKMPTHWESGLVYAVQPLSEQDSRYLFKMLLHKNGIIIPDKSEREFLENSIIGHAGLISTVVNYLRRNPAYRPSKTHAAVMQIVRAEVEKMLVDFTSHHPNVTKVVDLIGEASILSYPEIMKLQEVWPDFVESVDMLIDVGFMMEDNGNYYLAAYLQRYAQNFQERSWGGLAQARNILFSSVEGVDEDSYVPIELLDARIVEYLTSDTPVPGYLTNLIMPTQQLKAAKRHYDSRNYPSALLLAKEAYSQKHKLSVGGYTEAWRLVGLSGCRVADANASTMFQAEYKEIPKSDRREATYFFVMGFSERLKGNLRAALPHFEKITTLDVKDGHASRELAYIYAFEGRYELATKYIEKAKQTIRLSPYIIDVEAYIYLERYRNKKDASLIHEIDECLGRLEDADEREARHFAPVRKSMRDILVDDRYETLRSVFNTRSQLSVHPKVSLLELLSIKGKKDQYDTLLSELNSIIRQTGNKLAEVEVAKVEIAHLSSNGMCPAAREKLSRFSSRLTPTSVEHLTQLINSAEAYAAR
ncbi:toll/interleukin-1 receptor domain-containing protein [Pseudomonas sp. FW300-N2F2]|uniref:toll/interleukin-1 receptor domain-containing protein n=1 Tax=Pseudomonas sp. FW300-N2F2 TaxID=2751320 RepID=UPI001A9158F9|nr:toll/interleukin-1 receptor domain-containing protein [Pseudomonas sp. FW300-N2F2]